MQKLILASHNQGKLAELQNLLAPFALSIHSAAEFALIEPEETEASFAGNARIKAHFVSRETGEIALADDSGLSVAALDGAPGVYSADWTETSTGRQPLAGINRIAAELAARGATPPFAAASHSVLCVAWPDGRERLYQGRVDGTLRFPPSGVGGFGYDPIFVPAGHDRSFAEMTRDEKAALSHRSRAFDALLADPPFDLR